MVIGGFDGIDGEFDQRCYEVSNGWGFDEQVEDYVVGGESYCVRDNSSTVWPVFAIQSDLSLSAGDGECAFVVGGVKVEHICLPLSDFFIPWKFDASKNVAETPRIDGSEIGRRQRSTSHAD